MAKFQLQGSVGLMGLGHHGDIVEVTKEQADYLKEHDLGIPVSDKVLAAKADEAQAAGEADDKHKK